MRKPPIGPERNAWTVARVRAYLANGGQRNRDAFVRAEGSGGVCASDLHAAGGWRALIDAAPAAIEIDVSGLDFDDDVTTPGNYPAVPDSSRSTIRPNLIVAESPRPPEPRELLELQRQRAKTAEAERRLRDALEALHEADARAGVVGALRAAAEPPPIVRREAASGLREATAVVLASDLHLEEVVNPAAIEWRNAFNPAIARIRMERMAESALWLTDMHRSRIKIRDLVLWLGGDVISGFLHEENEETNALTPPQAILYAYELIGGLIKTLLARGDFESITVPCSCGNHGRSTQYTRAKTRVENSYELILYTQLAQLFADDPRVTFSIAGGSHLYLKIYEQTARFQHGDDVRYGGGIGGVTIPIKKALAAWQSFRHADWTALGHWHQLTWHRDFVVNGSLIGFNEYALMIKAEYEPPAQAFFLCDSKRGRTCFSPMWVASDDEGWQRGAA